MLTVDDFATGFTEPEKNRVPGTHGGSSLPFLPSTTPAARQIQVKVSRRCLVRTGLTTAGSALSISRSPMGRRLYVVSSKRPGCVQRTIFGAVAADPVVQKAYVVPLKPDR